MSDDRNQENSSEPKGTKEVQVAILPKQRVSTQRSAVSYASSVSALSVLVILAVGLLGLNFFSNPYYHVEYGLSMVQIRTSFQVIGRGWIPGAPSRRINN